MNNNKTSEVKLFGFRINNNIAVIIVFVIIPLISPYFHQLFSAIYTIIQWTVYIQQGTITITPVIINIIINNWVFIAISVILLPFYTYILIACSRTKKLVMDTEDSSNSWFGFKLTSVSTKALGILSLMSLIAFIITFFSYISPYLLQLLSPPIIFYLIIIERLSLMLMYLYTIFICRKAYSILTKSEIPLKM
ncbi:MAG: hypothetical protein JSV62_15885 [Promethearchaeota archaeon]|nr:MAG: hypothetical protein JSV62_15885 [Candidatus Lokiarchaeota archaeon]